MTVARLHNIHACKIGNTVIPAISKRGIRFNSDIRQEPMTGEVYARFQAMYGQSPTSDFQTRAIAIALGACGLTGTALTSAAPFLAYAQKNTEGGTRTSGSNHRKVTINEGIVIPRKLTVEHQGDAVLEYEVLATYDATNAICVLAESEALLSVTDAERFTLGSVTLNDGSTSYVLSQIRRLEIDFGIKAEVIGADSDIHPTSCRIMEIDPSLRLTGIDNMWWSSTVVPIGGLNIGHTSTAIYLRKRAAGGTFVAIGTAEHIKFTAAGLATIEGFDGSGNALDETTLYMPLKFDGTNNPLTINTASAIS